MPSTSRVLLATLTLAGCGNQSSDGSADRCPGVDWVERAPLPEPRHSLQLALATDRMIAVGGENASGASTASTWVVGEDREWILGPPLPRPVAGHTLAFDRLVSELGSFEGALSVGGYDGDTLLSDVWRLDDVEGWSASTELPVPTAHAASVITVSSDGMDLYVIGGVTPGGVTAEIWQSPYGIEDTLEWRSVGPLPGSRAHASALQNGKDVYILGGRDAEGQPVASVLAAELLPAGELGPWREISDLPAAGDRPFSVYGLVGGESTSKVWLTRELSTGYTNDGWHAAPDLPVRLSGHAVSIAEFAGPLELWAVGGNLADGSPTAAVHSLDLCMIPLAGPW